MFLVFDQYNPFGYFYAPFFKKKAAISPVRGAKRKNIFFSIYKSILTHVTESAMTIIKQYAKHQLAISN